MRTRRLLNRPIITFDHLGIREFMVLGFGIGGPFIWQKRTRGPLLID